MKFKKTLSKVGLFLFILTVTSFSSQIGFASDLYPLNSAVSNDFNGDHKSDIILVGGENWTTLPVAFSNGDGSFIVTNIANSYIPTWSRVSGTKTISGDFNGDGKYDFAIIGGDGWSTIPVAFSNGDGSFNVTNVANSNIPVWSNAFDVKVISGDFNGDRKTDIALVGGNNWATIPVAFSNGDGSFNVTNLANSYIPIWSRAEGAKVLNGDFNNDGKDDFALVGGAGWATIPVAFSNGDGSFIVTNVTNSNIPIWSRVSGAKITTGDFNGDRKTDIAMAGGDGWSTIPVAFSNGDGSFNVTNVANSYIPVWAKVAGVRMSSGDFNADGMNDLVLVGGDGWSTIPVAFSNGDGSFNVTNLSNSYIPVWARASGVKVINGTYNYNIKDNIVLIGGTDWSTIPVAFSNGDGSFNVTNKENQYIPSWSRVAGVKSVSGDFNGDGNIDFVLMGGAGWTTVPVAFANGDGTYRVTNLSNSYIPIWSRVSGVKVVSGDFNNDGKDDFALVGGAGWATIPVAFSNGDGSFSVTNVTNSYIPGWATASGVKAVSGDFNGDNKSDLVLVGGDGWSTIPVAFSNGDGSFSVTNIGNSYIPVWSRATGVKVFSGDYNRDGKHDIVLTGVNGWSTIPVAFSNGDGSFSVTNLKNQYIPVWSSVSGVKVVSRQDY